MLPQGALPPAGLKETQQLNGQLERTTCVSSDSQLGTQWRFKHYGNGALPLADLRLGHSL